MASETEFFLDYTCIILPIRKKQVDRNEPWSIFLEFVQVDEHVDMIYQALIIKAAVRSDPNDPIFLQYEQAMNIGFLPEQIGINHVFLSMFSTLQFKKTVESCLQKDTLLVSSGIFITYFA